MMAALLIYKHCTHQLKRLESAHVENGDQLMPIHKIKLLTKKEIAKDTIELTFEKPDGFHFIPGQYAGFTLIHSTNLKPQDNTRRFSLLSAPHEPHLRIAVRIQESAFKKLLNQLNIKEEIKMAGPTGQFVLPSDMETPIVLIAGGIGITPFYSMIHHAIHHEPKRRIQLFYGNSSRLHAAYLEELQTIQQTGFQCIPILTQSDPTWTGETGYITHTLLKKYIPDIHLPIYYICGSPTMVAAIQELLLEIGIGSDRIRVEDFPGY